MMAASASALTLAAPQIIFAPAHAQALPPGCTDAVTVGTLNNNNGNFNNGETITCVSVSTIPQISTGFDDLTIVIGDASTPTNVAGVPSVHTHGVRLSGGGTVQVNNAASTVRGENAGIEVSTPIASPLDITIVSEGAITATAGVGVIADNDGDGSIFIDVADVSGTLSGIRALTEYSTAGNISVISSGSVTTTDGMGVRASNNSTTGYTYVNVVDVTGGSTSDHGIFARNRGTDLTVIATGDVYGSDIGVFANNLGSGATSVSVNNVTAGGDAVRALAAASTTGDVTVTATGTLDATSLGFGVFVDNLGTGGTNISVADVHAYFAGIYLDSAATTTGDVTVTATGAVTSSNQHGILVNQDGSGDTTVSVVDVSATTGSYYGISVSHDGGDLSIASTGTINAGGYGVFANHDGTGATTVSVYNVTAGGHGVYVNAAASTTGDVYVGASGAVTSTGSGGIYVDNNGSGDAIISVHDVTGGAGDAIEVQNDGGNLSITSTGHVDAVGGRGVDAVHRGSGGAAVMLNSVDATGVGVRVHSYAGATGNLSLSATGLVRSGNDAIVLIQDDDDGVVVDVTDIAAGTGGSHDGIFIDNDGGDLTLNATGGINAGGRGVHIDTYNSSATNVSVYNVTTGGPAIDVYAGSVASGDISITSTGSLVSQAHAVFTLQRGPGAITIDTVNVTAGTGGGDDGIRLGSYGGDVNVISTGTITAGGDGIEFNHFGTGGTAFSVNNVYAGGDGLFLSSGASTTGNVAIGATGTITAGSEGVFLRQNGGGSVSINVADVTGGASSTATGISAQRTTGGDLTISSSGTVTGAAHGVWARNTGGGAGALTVSVNNAAGGTRDAIEATNNGGDLTITATGALSSTGQHGVSATNNGSGVTSINVDDVYAGASAGDYGIRVGHNGSDLSIVSTGIIMAGDHGVLVDHNGTGFADIAVDTVTVGGNGVYLDVDAAATGDISVTAMGAITAGGNGVLAIQNGSGATSINAADVYAGGGGNAFDVNHFGTDLSIASTGTITGSTGVFAHNRGTGATNVAVHNVDTSTDAFYVRAHGAATGDLTITATGAVNAAGFGHGVLAFNYGAGGTTIDVNSIATVNANAVSLDSGATTTGDVSLTASGTITTANDTAILLYQRGAGSTSINVADVYAGMGAGDAGIRVNHEGSDLDIVSTGTILGHIGVVADNQGSGGTSVSVNTVDVATNGIRVTSAASTSGDVSVTATGAVMTLQNSVFVEQYGSGSTSINVADVTAGSGDGHVGVRANHNGGDLSIASTGDISAGGYGIYSVNRGNGAQTISVHNVSANAYVGIYADNESGSATNLNVTATGHVAGYYYGVKATNEGTGVTAINVNTVYVEYGTGVRGDTSAGAGELSITATGLITALGAELDEAGVGIGARVNGNGVTVNAADIYAERYGIDILNLGGGAANVSAANVTSQYYYGVKVVNPNGTDVTVTTTGAVTGYGGVYIGNFSSGSTTINVNGVTGTDYDGIHVVQTTSHEVRVTSTDDVSGADAGIRLGIYGGGDAFVTATSVSGGQRGIDVLASSPSAIEITTTGVVSSSGGDGIFARSYASGDDGVTIDAQTVTGATNGVRARASGDGDLGVTGADISGASGDGINAFHTGSGAIRLTTSGDVSGGDRGIDAQHVGGGAMFIDAVNVSGGAVGIDAFTEDGDVHITSMGTVSSTSGAGVTVNTVGFDASNVDIDAATVTGETDGVYIFSVNDGDLSVSAGDVAGTTGRGVHIYNATGVGDIAVTTTGTVTAQDSGIDLQLYGTGDAIVSAVDVTSDAARGINVSSSLGALSISSTGTVSGATEGIFGRNTGDGALTISAYNVFAATGGGDAIEAYNSAAGTTLSVSTTGTVTSEDDNAIDAVNYGSDLVISTSGGSVAGEQSGIEALNYGSGATTISISNAVTGETDIGVFAVSPTGTEITIAEGGSVAGETAAISLDAASGAGDAVNDVLNLNSGGSISGDALLWAGDDAFNDASGDFTAVFGGDGTDTVNFAASAARVIDGSGGSGDSLQEFEVFNFNAGGFELAGDHTGLSETNFNAGTNRLSGSLTSTQTTVAEGATLNAAHGSTINGSLTVNGTLDIGDSPGTTTVDGDVVFNADSILPIETQGELHDLLIATGGVVLDGELQITHLGDLDVGTTTYTIIDGGTALSGEFLRVTGEDGLLVTNSIETDQSTFDVRLTTTVNAAASVDGLGDEEAGVGDHLIGLLAETALDPEFATFVNAVGSISDSDELGIVLRELQPEGFDAGLRFLANSQGRFASNVVDGPVHAVRREGPDGAHVWAALDLSRFSQSDNAQDVGFDGAAYEFSAGVSGIGRGNLRFGFAGGYASFSGDTKAGLEDDVDVALYRAAASARAIMDGPGANGRIDAVVSYAKGDNELAMSLIDPVSDAVTVQAGKADIRSIGVATRFTLTGVGGPNWPVQPHAEIGLAAVRQDEVSVGESGATALAVEKLDTTRAHFALGADFNHSITDTLSLNASATGLRYFGDTENVFESRFVAAPDDASSFRTIGSSVEWQARLRGGVSYEHKSGIVLSADAFGEAGDLNIYGARIEISKRF